MHFINLAIFLFSLSQISFAQDAPPIEGDCGAPGNSCSAYLDKVKALYDQGQAPAIVEPGDYAGRCYAYVVAGTHLNTTNPSAALLVVQDQDQNAGQGPLFPADDKMVFAMWVPSPPEPMNYYDDGQNISSGSSPLVATEQDNAWVAPNDLGVAFALRKNGDYFVVRAEVTANDGPLKPSDAFGYCYFFKKVQ